MRLLVFALLVAVGACGDAATTGSASGDSLDPPAAASAARGADGGTHANASADGEGLQCAKNELACNGACAPCAIGEGVARTSCGREGCVATCKQGYDVCASGCCKELSFASTPIGGAGRDLSMMFDKADAMHIGYGGFIPLDSLYYRSPTTPAVAIASSRPSPQGSISMRSSSVLDANDVPLFVYRYEAADWPEVHLSRRSLGTGNMWSDSKLPWLSNVSRTRLAQGGGVVGLAYESAIGGSVIAKRLDDPTKSFASCPGVPSWFDLAFRIDGKGVPHLACHVTLSTNGSRIDDVVYATVDGAGKAVLETVDPAFTQGRVTTHVELALALDGTPHVAYVDVVNREFVHAKRTASGWKRTTVAPLDASVLTMQAPDVEHALVVDGNGDAHVFFAQGRWKPMFHARQSSTAFIVRPIAPAPSVSQEIEAERDSKGQIHVLYQASTAATITRLSALP